MIPSSPALRNVSATTIADAVAEHLTTAAESIFSALLAVADYERAHSGRTVLREDLATALEERRVSLGELESVALELRSVRLRLAAVFGVETSQ